MALLKRAVCGALLLLASCDFLRDPVRAEFRAAAPLVSAMFRAGTDTVQVLLQRPESSLRGTEFLPLSGAEVLVRGPQGSIRLVEAADGFPACFAERSDHPGRPVTGAPERSNRGCYSAVLAQPIRPGTSYELRIVPAGEPDARGSTHIPGTPLIKGPERGAQFRLDRVPSAREPVDLEVSLHLQAGTAGIGVRLRPLRVYGEGRTHPNADCRIEQFSGVQRPRGTVARAVVSIAAPLECVDTSAVLPRRIAIDSLRAEVVVTAFDAGYMQYLDLLRHDAIPVEQASAGLEGAFGFLGSTSASRREVVLLPSPPNLPAKSSGRRGASPARRKTRWSHREIDGDHLP